MGAGDVLGEAVSDVDVGGGHAVELYREGQRPAVLRRFHVADRGLHLVVEDAASRPVALHRRAGVHEIDMERLGGLAHGTELVVEDGHDLGLGVFAGTEGQRAGGRRVGGVHLGVVGSRGRGAVSGLHIHGHWGGAGRIGSVELVAQTNHEAHGAALDDLARIRDCGHEQVRRLVVVADHADRGVSVRRDRGDGGGQGVASPVLETDQCQGQCLVALIERVVLAQADPDLGSAVTGIDLHGERRRRGVHEHRIAGDVGDREVHHDVLADPLVCLHIEDQRSHALIDLDVHRARAEPDAGAEGVLEHHLGGLAPEHDRREQAPQRGHRAVGLAQEPHAQHPCPARVGARARVELEPRLVHELRAARRAVLHARAQPAHAEVFQAGAGLEDVLDHRLPVVCAAVALLAAHRGRGGGLLRGQVRGESGPPAAAGPQHEQRQQHQHRHQQHHLQRNRPRLAARPGPAPPAGAGRPGPQRRRARFVGRSASAVPSGPADLPTRGNPRQQVQAAGGAAGSGLRAARPP